MPHDNVKFMGLQPRTGMDRFEAMKRYDEPYTTPYYDELKEHGIRLPCFLTHIRTDECRRIKPKDARMFRMMFTPPRVDGCCGTLDTRPMSNLIMEWNQIHDTPYTDALRRHGIRLPSILTPIRTVEGREKRRHGIEVFRNRFVTPRMDGMSNTITSVQKDNLLMLNHYPSPNMELTYHEHPTKEQLLEYFSQRIRVRKMTPREAFRLMDVDDSDIDKIMNAEQTVTLKNGTTKTRKAISKTACYKLAGNSIVVSCLYHIFRMMFISGQPEIKKQMQVRQMTIFDYL